MARATDKNSLYSITCVCAYMFVGTCICSFTWRLHKCYISLHFIPLRQGLSRNLEPHWQLGDPSHSPVSGPHRWVQVTMLNFFGGCWGFVLESSCLHSKYSLGHLLRLRTFLMKAVSSLPSLPGGKSLLKHLCVAGFMDTSLSNIFSLEWRACLILCGVLWAIEYNVWSDFLPSS